MQAHRLGGFAEKAMIRRIALAAIVSVGWMLFAMPSIADESETDTSEAPEIELPNDAIQEEPRSIEERAYDMLSPRERAALYRGPYSPGQVAGALAASTIVGFGSGHAVQGRWKQLGWVFTLGESVTLGLGLGLPATCDKGHDDYGECEIYLAVLPLLAFGALRITEIFETSVNSATRNVGVSRAEKKLEAIKKDLREKDRGLGDDLLFDVHPNRDGGATFAVGLRF